MHLRMKMVSKANAINKQENDSSAPIWAIRILLLTFYACKGSVQPFLSVYYLSLGHSGTVIGILGAIQPVVFSLVSPMWGILADKYNAKHNNRHFLLQLCLIGWLISTLLLPWGEESVVFLGCLVFVKSIFQAPLGTFVDTVAMSHLPNKDQYGRLRLFGTIGFGLGMSVVGFLLNHANQYELPVPLPTSEEASGYEVWVQWLSRQNQGYRIAFFSFAVLFIQCWVCVHALARASKRRSMSQIQSRSSNKSEAAKDEKRIKDGLLMLTKNREALVFLFFVFLSGFSSGCSENFTYARMQEVGASSSFIGNTRLLASSAGTVMFWYSHKFNELLGGPVNVLMLSPLLYAVRFLIYGTMTKPYHALPAEILRGINFGSVCSTSTIYAHTISPPGMTTTMLMFKNAVYTGLGPSMGALVSGKLQTSLGTAATMINVACFNVCVVCLMKIYCGMPDSAMGKKASDKVKSQ